MYFIRPIQTKDDPKIAQVIREVSKEYGLATDAGFAVSDPILDQMSEVYHHPNSQYWVIVDQHDNVLGGGGIAPLLGDSTLLEIQKMYFLPRSYQMFDALEVVSSSNQQDHQYLINSFLFETLHNIQILNQYYDK